MSIPNLVIRRPSVVQVLLDHPYLANQLDASVSVRSGVNSVSSLYCGPTFIFDVIFYHRHHLDPDPSLPPDVNICLCGASHNNHHCPHHPFTIFIFFTHISSEPDVDGGLGGASPLEHVVQLQQLQ